MTTALRTELAQYADRCSHGFALLEQHPQLCDCQNAEAGKTAGIAAADLAASPDERSRIDAAIRQVAARGGVWSANDVRVLVPDVSGPLMGARFNAAAKAGLITRVGYEPSTKGSTHGHPVAQWRAAA